MSETWNSLKLIRWTTEFFEKKGILNPRLDAELLLAHALKCQRIDLYTDHERKIPEKGLLRYRALVERRGKREPLQQILGETEFYGLKLTVTPDVLIPRPETELLVEEVVKLLNPPTPPLSKGGKGGFSILDIGTGSGCIAIALAKGLPEARVIATDISEKALEVARQNAKAHQVEKQIDFVLADIAPWKRFQAAGTKFNLIVSNPPYIPSGEFELLQPEVRDFEPRKALEGGPEGLDFIRRILKEGSQFLKPGGTLLLEIGDNQEDLIKSIIRNDEGFKLVNLRRDYAGHPRVIILKKRFSN